MSGLGLRGRLILTYLALVFLGVGGLVLRFGFLEEFRIIEETEHDLEIKAFLLEGFLEEPLNEFLEHGRESGADSDDSAAAGLPFERTLDSRTRSVIESLGSRLTVLTAQGTPIYDNQLDFLTVSNQIDQIEVQAALQGREQHHIRFDPDSEEERLYAAVPISHEEHNLGVVQLSIPTAAMQARIRQSWLILAGTALVIGLTVVLTSLWLANYILRPIQNLQQAAIRMSTGDLEQHLRITGSDELSRLAEAFNHMAAQLKQMINQQQQFVANASHELRTPLTNIKLRAEALLDGARHDPEVAEKFLGQIEGEADRLSGLTRSLLTLSAIDSGLAIPSTEPVNVKTILSESLEAFGSTAEVKRIDLLLDCPSNSPCLEANPSQLRLVFDNLLENALKYTPVGGRVIASVQQSGGEAVIAVTDTGQGIPPEDMPHIFERFYRVDKARTRSADPGGSGLGLSIVQAIVKAHHGRIYVTSAPRQGTTFTLHLPLPVAGISTPPS